MTLSSHTGTGRVRWLRATWPELLVLTALGAFLALLFLRPVWDIDIFWHIAAGREFRRLGHLVTLDPMGLDPSRRWVSFQWGYQLAVSAVHDLGGWPALRALHAAILLAAFGLFHRLHRALLGPWRGLAATLLLLLLYQDRINVRPDVVNLLGLAVLLPLLLAESPAGDGSFCAPRLARGGWLGIVGLGLFMALWATVHAGGELNHLIVALAVPIGVAVDKLRGRARHASVRAAALFWLGLALPCVFVPHFLSGALDALVLVRSGGASIEEWSAPIAYVLGDAPQPPGRIVTGLLPYAALLAFLVLALRGQLARLPLHRVGLALGFLGLSLLFVRFVYFTLPAALCLLPALSGEVATSAPKEARRQWLTVAAVVTLAGLVWHTNVERLHGGLRGLVGDTHSDLDQRRYPEASADYLHAVGFRGSIFAHARFGSYLLYRLHPGVRVLVDGRFAVPAETAADIQRLHEIHSAVPNDPSIATEVERIIERYPADVVVAEPPLFASPETACPRWSRVFVAWNQEVWVRRDSVEVRRLEALGSLPLPVCP